MTAAAIELDVARSEERKRQAARRLAVVLDPLFRLIGFYLVALAVWLHNSIMPTEASPPAAQLVLVFGLYPLLTWAMVGALYDRLPSLADVLLAADVAMLVLAVYFSGGDRSPLFFFPILRVVDQTHTTFPRALVAAHGVVAAYLAMLVWLVLVERRDVLWPEEAVKAGALYLGALYTAFTARTAEAAKARTREAIRLTRQSTARLQASESDLRRVMHENERILQSAAEGIVGFDIAARVVFANRRAAKTIGYDVQDLIGRHGHELAAHAGNDGRVCDGTDCPLESVLRSGVEQSGINPGLYRDDGSVIQVEYTSAPMFGGDGRLTGAVLSFRDVSRRLAMETELRAAKEDAEQASRAKSLFLANMSHELRTPLNAIIGYAELLGDELRDEKLADYATDADRIRGAGQTLLAMITDILDIAKADAGKLQLVPQAVEIAPFVRDLVEADRARFASRGNTLDLHCDADAGTVRTDAQMLRRVLHALLDNANKFSDRAATALRVTRRDDRVIFAVADRGRGMTAEQIGRIFQPFQPGDASTRKTTHGAGVGLALSCRMAELMGGRIDVQSEPETGSVVSLELPMTQTPVEVDD